LSKELPGSLLHLFGHIHQFSDHVFKETKYINVASLDRPISARPRSKRKWSKEDVRNFNAGNYVTLEINSSLEVTARCINLPHEYPNWIPLDDRNFHGIGWIPEEAKWAKPADQPLLQYETWRGPKVIEAYAHS
jgi:hypothetical protein